MTKRNDGIEFGGGQVNRADSGVAGRPTRTGKTRGDASAGREGVSAVRGRGVRAWAPGRTEVAGNHVDHQGGRVINAAVGNAVEMEVVPASGDEARLDCGAFGQVAVDLSEQRPVEAERTTTAALVRGVAAGLVRAGVPVGGFEARVESTLPAGGGMSSSAAFEVALAGALDALFGSGSTDPLDLARIGQRAEREFFGKPCGLQDQAASALGGLNLIDFADEAALGIEALPFDFAQAGWSIMLVDTACDHSAYTDDFSLIEADMRAVASLFGEEVLGCVGADVFMDGIGRVRSELGDRRALRALHFFNERALVDVRAQALREGDMEGFLRATRRSARSSAQYLGNVLLPDGSRQPAMMAIALADWFLGDQGAVRIHGGGFGGTVQVFVPAPMAMPFSGFMEQTFAEGCCTEVRVSPRGLVVTPTSGT